jgi:hypothetical protein
MLPDEGNNRESIRKAYGRCLDLGAVFVGAGAKAIELCCENKTLDTRAMRFGLGMLAMSTRRLRAIIALLELGLVEDAEILLRSLFESLLAFRFVFRRQRALQRCSPGLQQALKRWPKIPSTMPAPVFRALLYDAHEMFQTANTFKEGKSVKGIARRCASSERRIAPIVTGVAKLIGPWHAILTNRPYTYSGLTVAQLAELYGLQKLHRSVYALMSIKTHGGRATQSVTVDGEQGGVRMHGEIEMLSTVALTSMAVFGMLLGDANRAFALKQEASLGLMQTALIELNRVYNPRRRKV